MSPNETNPNPDCCGGKHTFGTACQCNQMNQPVYLPETGLFAGEREAINDVLRHGAAYGYGNMIAHLRKAWAENLRDKYGFPDDAAIRATESSPYPLSPKKG